jgi:hypothetical protein
MGSLEDRLRRLEERLVEEPTCQEYLDASNRERTRALHLLAKRLAPYGFDGDYLFVEANWQMLAKDTPEQLGRDREIVEAWYKAQGVDRRSDAEGARERLLAKLEGRGNA